MLALLFIAQASRDIVLDTVNVLSSPLERSRVAGSATYIDEKKLDEHKYNDVERVLQDTPGVYVRGEDGFGLRPNIGMRGVSSDRSAKITLMEDGVLFAPAPYSAPAAYYFPLMQRVTGVEVWKGPAAIRYGPNTIGGALNLTTRPLPRRFTGVLDAAAGMYNQRSATGTIGWGNDRYALMLDGGFIGNDGFKRLPGRENTGFDKNEFLLKAGYNTPLDRTIVHAFELKLGFGSERSNETYVGLTDDDFAKDPYARYAATALDQMNWWRTQGALSYVVTGGELWELNVTAYRNDLARTWKRLNTSSGPTLLQDVFHNNGMGSTTALTDTLRGQQDSAAPLQLAINNRQFVSQGAQATFALHLDSGPVRNDVEVGLRFHYDEIVRKHDAQPYDMRSGVLVPNAGPTVPTARNKASTWAASLYVQDKLQWKNLLVVPGIRFELIESHLDDSLGVTVDEETGTSSLQPKFRTFAWMPGIGAHYALADWVSVLAGVYKGFSPKTPGSPDSVLPEQSINYEAGVRAQHKYVSGEVVGFFSDYQNITAVCSPASGCASETFGITFNGGRAWVYGLEASAKSELPLVSDWALALSASYTLTASRFLSSFDSGNPLWGSVIAGDMLPYVPVHQAAASVGVHDRQFSASIAMRYNGEMRDFAGQGSIPASGKIPQYVYFDAAAHYQLDSHVRIYALLDNMFNQTYAVSRQPFGLRPGKPLLFQAGARFSF